MTAYLVGHITVKDNGLWQEYMAGVQESLEVSRLPARISGGPGGR